MKGQRAKYVNQDKKAIVFTFVPFVFFVVQFIVLGAVRLFVEDVAMRLDIRIPIGLMFAILGAMLGVFGIISDKSIYDRSLGININIWWGLVLLAFGVAMFVFGRGGTSAIRPTDESPEGRKIEEREHRMGLEREPGDRQKK